MTTDGTHGGPTVDQWPDNFDEEAAAHLALEDSDDPGELAAMDEHQEVAFATGITSHQLRCRQRHGSRYFINDNSSFAVPHTDEYLVRVALFNRQGARVYLGPFRSKGTANGYRTLLHTEAVWDDGHLTHRSLVLWKSVNGRDVWNDWKFCTGN